MKYKYETVVESFLQAKKYVLGNKSLPVPFCTKQILHAHSRDISWAFTVTEGSQVVWFNTLHVIWRKWQNTESFDFTSRKLRQWPTWCTLALFYNTSTTILYMLRALYAHHQEVELYWCSIWYRPLSQWPSGAQVEKELQSSSVSTCAPEGHWMRGQYQMLHQYISPSWWWACNDRNM